MIRISDQHIVLFSLKGWSSKEKNPKTDSIFLEKIQKCELLQNDIQDEFYVVLLLHVFLLSEVAVWLNMLRAP